MIQDEKINRPSKTEEIIFKRRRENTHKYWFPLIISKKDEPGKRKIVLESYAYTLPDIEYKAKRGYLEKVAKEFNQKMKIKFNQDIYQISPIFWDTLCLEQEDAEKVKKRMIEAEKKAASMMPSKKR